VPRLFPFKVLVLSCRSPRDLPLGRQHHSSRLDTTRRVLLLLANHPDRPEQPPRTDARLPDTPPSRQATRASIAALRPNRPRHPSVPLTVGPLTSSAQRTSPCLLARLPLPCCCEACCTDPTGRARPLPSTRNPNPSSLRLDWTRQSPQEAPSARPSSPAAESSSPETQWELRPHGRPDHRPSTSSPAHYSCHGQDQETTRGREGWHCLQATGSAAGRPASRQDCPS
jgi:hypothetical protein